MEPQNIKVQVELLFLDCSKFPVDAGFLSDKFSFPGAGVKDTINCTPRINDITQARNKQVTDSYFGRYPVRISVAILTSLPVW
jgi:hypothetical protein